MTYHAPHWLPGGHLQTIYPALCIKHDAAPLRRERWETPDGDFIDVDFCDGEIGQPMLVLFHGLEGSSHSHYARALMHRLRAEGWHGAIPHFRGCSGELNLAPRFYHSGDSQEIDWIVRRLYAQHRAHHATAPFYVSGVSLGGNALLRWLGESQSQAGFVNAACAISAPLDLTAGGATLGRGFNRIYTRMFLRTLKPKCLQKLQQFPRLFDERALRAASNFYEFDNAVTAPLHGYHNVEDYWHRASARHILTDIQVPTLVLNAKNDPFLPGRYLPTQAASIVQLDYPETGGHVGFAQGQLPGSNDWLPNRMLHFLTHG